MKLAFSHSSRERSSRRDVDDRGRDLLTCVFLVLGVAVMFYPLLQAGFINYDDPDFVTANAHVRRGLTAGSLAWAVQSMFIYWQPLTWISYMADYELRGLNPAGFHLTNIALHAANTLLLYVVLRRATGAYWRCVLVALLFAFHPLHVETVAWISERKGLLSTLFGFLALAAYLPYARQPGLLRYLLVAACFALSLMAKSMLVTLPAVFLLLDWWPLRRFPFPSWAGSAAAATATHRSDRCPPRSVGFLLLEKVPLLLLAMGSAALSVVAQRQADAFASLQQLPLGDRLANAVVGYGWYLLKTVWPVDLSVFYPRPDAWPAALVALSAGVLVCGSALAIVLLRRAPYLGVGWFWFLGTLLPVIGLVQVGDQAYADRYSYVPLVGLLVAGVWAAAELAALVPAGRKVLAVAAALAVLGCAHLTARQVRCWQNTETLFDHALQVNPDNALAWAVVGSLRAQEGRYDEAYRLFERALQLNPRQSDAHVQWGSALADREQLDAAADHFEQALRIKPAYADAQLALGMVRHRQGRREQAVQAFERALALRPDWAAAHNNLAMVLFAQDRKDDAIRHLLEAIALEPGLATAHLNLARAYGSIGQTNEAEVHYQAAREATPPTARARLELADALLSRGRTADALAEFQSAARLGADDPVVLNNVAWVFATHPSADMRRGEEAVGLAERACALTDSKQAVLVGTLAAAYAEAGRFDQALATAQKARDLALAGGDQAVAETNRKLMELYRSGKPFRQTAQ